MRQAAAIQNKSGCQSGIFVQAIELRIESIYNVSKRDFGQFFMF
jgi:hypothetical protein